MKKKIIVLFFCIFLIATTVPTIRSLNTFSGESEKNVHTVVFSQVDWFYQGTPLMIDSLWGRIDILTTPDSSFWYMNIVADAGYGPAWILQNYPIFPEGYHLPTEQVVFFNIAELGFQEGMSLDAIAAVISFERTPLQTQPHGEILPYNVTSSIRDAWGHTTEPPQTIDEPAGHKAVGEVTDAIKHTNISSVQEAPKNCITGAYARSIKWLDTTYDLENLPPDKTAQDLYNALAALGIGHGTGQGKTEEEMLEIKAAYLKVFDDRAITKFVDLTNWMSTNVTGCTEENPDNLKDWLQEELQTEDVELFYDRHCITIAGIYTQNNSVFLEYRDDERQGNNSVGDTSEKEGELTQTNDQWFFDGAPIDYVVSESINEAPEKPVIDGPTSGKPRIPHKYNVSTTDPNLNQVYYLINWSDDTPEERIGPYNSNEVVTATHTWLKRGTYSIKAKAIDEYNASSDWATLSVKIPCSYTIRFQHVWEKLFELFPHAFPILRYLVEY